MKISFDLVKSKIARRFCLLFFFCAFIPTFFLFYISFNRVTEQLEQQNYLQMKQETKAYGLSLFDRLVRVDNTLRSLAGIISSATGRDSKTDEYLGRSVNKIFEAIELYQLNKKAEPILGSISAEELAAVIQEFKGTKETQIVVRPSVDQVDRIFFIVPNFQGNELMFLLIGEAKPDYVWGVGVVPLLPSKIELSVYGEDGRRMFGTAFSPGSKVDGFSRENVDSDLRLFKYTMDGKKFLASSRDLFVRSNFANGSWLVVLSQSEGSMLASIHDFKEIFLLITLLALFLTLFLSLTFIRRNLEPLNLLKEGTKQIANRNFSVALDIHSGDEFEDLGASFNSMTMQLRKQFNALAAIDKINRAILSSLDQVNVIDTSLKMLKKFFHVDIIILGRLVESASMEMKIHILKQEQEPIIKYVTINEEEKKQIVIKQPYSVITETHLPKFIREMDSLSYSQILCLPIFIEKQFQSILILGKLSKHDYDNEELKQARQLADQVTIALSNAKLVMDLEKLIASTIEALARTVDAKSKWTAGHSERVAALAGRIGRQMGCNEEQVDMLARGGLLHDIGKIGIRMAIIDKPGRLTEDEFNEIKTHPLISQQILDPIEAYRNILPMIVQHHERYDGAGYPSGLSGEDIDPFARILMVADVYDALVSDRPYREGWDLTKARNYIAEGAGTSFEPDVVEAFLELSL